MNHDRFPDQNLGGISMGKKRKLSRNFKYRLVIKQLENLYGEDITKQIAIRADAHFEACEALCVNVSKGERQHLDGTILLTVSFYKALLDIDDENALRTAHTAMVNLCEKSGAAVSKLLVLPCMKSVFMWLLAKMAVSMFGENCGFSYRNYQANKKMLKMDMTACPYCRYAERFGCPELTPVFCDSDLASYGKLPGIRFERTQTLGTGGDCCDFCFTRE